jgi:hypothetical protein
MESGMRNTVIALIASVALAACGGGGGSAGVGFGSGAGGSSAGGGGGTVALGAAQGYYNGSSSAGDDLAIVALENGGYWTLRLRNGVVHGVAHGTATTTATSVSGTGSDYELASGSPVPGTLSASYSVKSAINGSMTPGGATFSAVYDPGYETPASIASLVGTWNGEIVSPAGLHGGAITIDADGSVHGFVTNCSYMGTARPRASGRAVFDITLTFATSGCELAGQAVGGIAALRAAGGGRALVTATVLGDGSAAFAFAATR